MTTNTKKYKEYQHTFAHQCRPRLFPQGRRRCSPVHLWPPRWCCNSPRWMCRSCWRSRSSPQQCGSRDIRTLSQSCRTIRRAACLAACLFFVSATTHDGADRVCSSCCSSRNIGYLCARVYVWVQDIVRRTGRDCDEWPWCFWTVDWNGRESSERSTRSRDIMFFFPVQSQLCPSTSASHELLGFYLLFQVKARSSHTINISPTVSWMLCFWEHIENNSDNRLLGSNPCRPGSFREH